MGGLGERGPEELVVLWPIWSCNSRTWRWGPGILACSSATSTRRAKIMAWASSGRPSQRCAGSGDSVLIQLE